MPKKTERFVLVTTNRRGVFAGVLEEHHRNDNGDGDRVVLSQARMCVYWPSANRGVLGLAADGPKPGAKITPAVPLTELEGVHKITDCTEEARVAWEGEPWG